MTRKAFVFLFLISVVFAAQTTVVSAEAEPTLKKGEQLFSEDYDRVWDATIAVITEKGFATHPHKKMKAKKKKGKIKTPVWRYFKIWSAQPVIEKQYKDSYKIKIKKIEIDLPQAVASKAKEEVPATDVEGNSPAAPAKDAEADKSADGAEAAALKPPPPTPTVTKVLVSIKRIFQVHNDETRKWVKGDPEKEMVGYSVKDLFKGIEAKLSGKTPADGSVKQANLNINPPPIHSGVRP